MITEILGGLLQFLTVASLVAAFTVLLLGLGKPLAAGPRPEPVPGHPSSGKRTWLWVAAIAIGSRLALVALAYLALAVANAAGTEEVKSLLANYGFDKPFPPLESMFSRWDAPHYLDIASQGYTADQSLGDLWLFIVFYPLYPALAALLKPLFGTVFNAATAISWLSLAGASALLWKLADEEGAGQDGNRAVKYLLLFPAAIFLGAPYTESLFLFLSALSLWAMRKEKWWLAGLAGFFAALARNMGLLLAVPFAVELLDRLGVLSEPRRLLNSRFWVDFLRRGAWVLLIPLGAATYLLINQAVYGDPFMFLQIQSDHWGQHAQAPWKTVLTTWSNLIGSGSDPAQKQYLWAPQIAGMAAMLIALPFLMRKMRPAWAAYLLVYTVVSLSPSWLLSFNRYMMGAIPLFLGLAVMTRKKTADTILTIVFAAAMLFLAAGYLMWKHVV